MAGQVRPDPSQARAMGDPRNEKVTSAGRLRSTVTLPAPPRGAAATSAVMRGTADDLFDPDARRAGAPPSAPPSGSAPTGESSPVSGAGWRMGTRATDEVCEQLPTRSQARRSSVPPAAPASTQVDCPPMNCHEPRDPSSEISSDS
jgi:hypothetical protein